MFDKNTLFVYAAMILLGVWGGAVKYFRKLTAGAKFAWWRFAGELSTSALVGFLIGTNLLETGASIPWVLACAAIAGHMGGNLFEVGEEILKSVLWNIAKVERRGASRDEPPQP